MFATNVCNDRLTRKSTKRNTVRQHQSFKRLHYDKGSFKKFDSRDDNIRELSLDKHELSIEEKPKSQVEEKFSLKQNQRGGFTGWVLSIKKRIVNLTKKFKEEEGK